MNDDALCDRCYTPLSAGVHGVNVCPYEPRRDMIPSQGFEPRFDIGLGEYVTGWGDIRQQMRRKHLDFRDHPSPGDLSARRDRAMQQRRERVQ